MHTQKLIETGDWRIRFTDADNAPFGREIHWSHSLIWWLLLVGSLHSLVTGWPLPAAVEAAATYANTLILGLFIVLTPWILLRRFGLFAACAYAVSLAGVPLFLEQFIVGNPDHHGIAAATALLCSLFLARGGGGWLGFSRQDTPPTKSAKEPLIRARIDFVLSGVFGGMCLWVSAATAGPILLGLGTGAALSFLVPIRGDSPYEPRLWRWWGVAGGSTSLLFYLLEYAPAHFGMRLEVNHPFYGIAWVAGGELLFRMALWRKDGVRPWKTLSGMASIIFCLLGLLLLPAFAFGSPSRYFLVSDPFLWNLHRDYIREFHNIFASIGEIGPRSLAVILSPAILAGALCAPLLANKSLAAPWKTVLLVVSTPAFLVTVMGLWQVRWLGTAYALWIAAFPVCLAAVGSLGKSKTPAPWLVAVACCLPLAIAIQQPAFLSWATIATFAKGSPLVGSGDLFQVAIRDAAYSIKKSPGGKDKIVLSGPTSTSWLMYYGGLRGVGTLYWENLAGLKASAEIYQSQNSDEALRQIKSRGITDIAIFSIDDFAAGYVDLFRELPKNTSPRDTFANKLLYEGIFPPWLTPLNYRLPQELKGQWLALAEVHQEQDIAEADLAVARWYASKGRFTEAVQKLRDAIAARPDLKDARLELAAFLFLSRSPDEARRQLEIGLDGQTPEKTAEVCSSIGAHLQEAGLHPFAAELLRRAIKASPAAPGPRDRLAWLLATSKDNSVRNTEEALIMSITNMGFLGSPSYFQTLAAAQASNRQYEDAISSVKKAIQAAENESPPRGGLLSDLKKNLALYRLHIPLRE